MIKKLGVLVLVLALIVPFAGCCERMVDGKVTKSIANCLTEAQDFICAPPAEVKAVADAAVPLLVAVMNTLVPGTAPFINVNNAAATATKLQQGVCVFVTELNNLISVLQSTTTQDVQAKIVGTKALPKAIDLQVLINWQIVAAKKPK